MVDRHMVGDLALAVLIALPLAALAKSQPAARHPSAAPVVATVALADRAPSGRLSLLG